MKRGRGRTSNLQSPPLQYDFDPLESMSDGFTLVRRRDRRSPIRALSRIYLPSGYLNSPLMVKKKSKKRTKTGKAVNHEARAFSPPKNIFKNVNQPQEKNNFTHFSESQQEMNYNSNGKSHALRSKKAYKENQKENISPSRKFDVDENVHQHKKIPKPKSSAVDDSLKSSMNFSGEITSVDELFFTVKKDLQIYRHRCFLYGISVHHCNMKDIVKIGQVVQYEMENHPSTNVKECWIGKPMSNPEKCYEMVASYCKQNAMSTTVKCSLLNEIDFIPRNCAPLMGKCKKRKIVSLGQD